MNYLSIIPMLLVFFCAMITDAQSSTPHGQPSGETSQSAGGGSKAQLESPFACVVDALTPSERKRHFDELGPMLRGLKTGIRELRDGFEFRFPSDRKTFDLVSEWAIQEQLCCPFFEISIRLDKEAGPLWLRLTGRKGTKEFIHDDFAKWFTE